MCPFKNVHAGGRARALALSEHSACSSTFLLKYLEQKSLTGFEIHFHYQKTFSTFTSVKENKKEEFFNSLKIISTVVNF